MNILNIKPAVSGKYHHSYSPTTVASLDLGDLLCDRIIECLPGDDWSKVHGSGVLRVAPLSFPAYGRSYVKTASFFVPEHQLIEFSPAYHANQSSYQGQTIHLPHFASTNINYFFASTTGLSTFVGSTANPVGSPVSASFDFCYVYNNSGSPSYHFFKLTRLGERYYKILKSLGYDFCSFSYSSSYTYSLAFDTGLFNCNALPLLAYVKCYIDIFLNGVFYNTSPIVALMRSIRQNQTFSSGGNTYFDSSTGDISSYGLSLLVQGVRVPHSYNMYNQSWNDINSPSGVSPNSELKNYNPSGLISPLEVNSESLYSNQSFNGINTTFPLTENGLRILKAFDSFVRRWNISGSKAVQRIYNSFGIKSDDFNTHFVHKIYEGSSDIKFSPVLSNTDSVNGSNGKVLGAYAGLGVSGLNFDFNYNCSDFGYIVILSWIQIVPMLRRGFHPSVLRANPFDFFTPEYDGQAYRAIPDCEISVNKNSTDDESTYGNGDKKTFGFTNIYNDYRELRDSILGDFVNRGAEGYVLCRDVSLIRENSNYSLVPQSDLFHYFDMTSNSDMSNPFQFTWANGDRFYLQIDFDIEANRFVKSYSDALNLGGEGDLKTAINGNDLS